MNDASTSSKRETLQTLLIASVAVMLAGIPAILHPGYYFHDDMQTQYIPVLHAMGTALLEGRWPLRLDGTWFGGAIAGEYQHGVFSLVHLFLALCASALRLSPAATATTVTLVYAGITAAGSHRLARELGVSAAAAGLVAMVAALNGFNVLWGSWLPALAGFAWVPWFWWATVRRLRAPGSFQGQVALALTTYLVLSAGWHFAAMMSALIALYSLLATRGARPLGRACLALAPGLATGVLLAAPALLCFFEYAVEAARTDFDRVSSTWTVPLPSLLGLLLPRTTSVWQVFGNPENHPNVALANGVLPTLVVLAAFFRTGGTERREHLPLLVFAGVALVLALTPSLGRMRWPFRWLPLFHLAFGLAAAHLADVRNRPPFEAPRTFRAVLSFLTPWAVLAGLLAVLFSRVGMGFAQAAGVAVASSALVDVLGRNPARVPFALGLGLVANLLVTPLWGPTRDSTPGWDLSYCRERLGDAARDARHLGIYLAQNVIDDREAPYEPVRGQRGCLLPGNLGLLFDRAFVNGYSTLFPRGLYGMFDFGVHGDIGRNAAHEVFGVWAEPGSLFDRWGVGALTAPDVRGVKERLRSAGWRPVRDLGGGALYTREHLARSALVEPFSPAELASLDQVRGRANATGGRAWIYSPPRKVSGARSAVVTSKIGVTLLNVGANSLEAEVRTEAGGGPGLVLVRWPVYPGYRADLDGRSLELGAADGVFVVVEVPPGTRGRLTLAYRPLGIRFPGIVAVLAGMTLLVVLVVGARRERRGTTSDSALY